MDREDTVELATDLELTNRMEIIIIGDQPAEGLSHLFTLRARDEEEIVFVRGFLTGHRP